MQMQTQMQMQMGKRKRKRGPPRLQTQVKTDRGDVNAEVGASKGTNEDPGIL
jgi:hypothetical protein